MDLEFNPSMDPVLFVFTSMGLHSRGSVDRIAKTEKSKKSFFWSEMEYFMEIGLEILKVYFEK